MNEERITGPAILVEDDLAGLTPAERELIERQAAGLQAEAAANAAAASQPLPGPLLKAFAPEPTLTAGFRLVPLLAGHLPILQAIDSPLLRVVAVIAANAGKPADEVESALKGVGDAPFEAIVETFFVFTQPPPRLRALLAEGRHRLREAAMAEVADRIGLAEAGELALAVGRHFAGAFATVIKYKTPGGGGGETVFTTPPAKATG